MIRKSKKSSMLTQIEIEGMVDTHGLGAVMGMLMNICYEKAEHVRANGQDDDEAMSWERDGNKLDAWYGAVEH